jgi:hypothetical protein
MEGIYIKDTIQQDNNFKEQKVQMPRSGKTSIDSPDDKVKNVKGGENDKLTSQFINDKQSGVESTPDVLRFKIKKASLFSFDTLYAIVQLTCIISLLLFIPQKMYKTLNK